MSDASDRDLRMLEGLDRYAVRRRIATGGMASVWSARDRALGRSVAIKLISRRFARDHAALSRFDREARAAARLSGHRHVVTIYDVGRAVDPSTALGRPFIVMEFLSGGTVADAIRVHAVTREQAVQWLQQAAAAIDYAHSRGVIHRDIKPVNMLLDSERVLHVADFGIARLASEDTAGGAGQLLGTVAYIAPEQVLGQPATEASDRYALAVAAFELLAGQRPFAAASAGVEARRRLEDEPPAASRLNPELPGAVDGVLARGMAKRPEERWATASEFAGAIAVALGAPRPAPTPLGSRRPAPVPTEPPVRGIREPTPVRGTPFPPARGQPHRRLAVGALAAGALGVGVAAAASGMFGSGDQRSPVDTTARLRAAAPPARTVAPHVARRHPAPAPTPKRVRPSAITTSTTAATTTSAGTVQASPAANTTRIPAADELQARGHELLADGHYGAAIPVLRHALSTTSPSSLTYAYALFDLGRSLRLAGDPKAAVTVLWQRMQIPNQTEMVRGELQLALRALGAQAHSAPSPKQPRPRSQPTHGDRTARA